MLVHELRQKYIEFFVGKAHLLAPSAPLVPIDHLGVQDTSTLFSSAGMQQFKPYFTGDARPPCPRMVTVQKCVRTTDIESVGDFSHCTFFEMLGNFSFGDYFKKEVIAWTWEFLTEHLKLDPNRMCVTVFLDDDEAYAVWRDVVGLPEDRIHRLGEDKNYWPANAISQGPDGPCGPCTEIFYRVVPVDQMTTDPALTPTERYRVDDDAGRWLEIWNNVFTQFNRGTGPGGEATLTPLPSKNNDTGAGLERIAGVLQGKRSVFDVDVFVPVIGAIQELSGLAYGGTNSATDFAFRVVAEHTRTSVFCLADGILPSNEGRGYVMRRIMRRAIRYGKAALGFSEPFLYRVAPAIIEKMGDAYPELRERREYILRNIRAEEERFLRTLDNGTQRLLELLDSPATAGGGALPGADAFTLYDTYGFPLELTREMASERGIAVDQAGFEAAMEEQRRRSQEANAMTDVFKQGDAGLAELSRTLDATEFVGYAATQIEDAVVLAILREGEIVAAAAAGQTVDVLLDRTPFYAESGGQVGDTGAIAAAGAELAVTDTQKAAGLVLHRAEVKSGELRVGQAAAARVDAARRMDIRRNHTATHLLHAALREVLGDHVHQKGSQVSAAALRFDFTHTQPVSDAELREVEAIANRMVLGDAPVVTHADLPIAEARARGAMALFGEKYGDHVRMVEVPGLSVELCGGTHLDRTSQAGLIKIMSETGIAAGVRRIEARTGPAVYEWMRDAEDQLAALTRVLKTSRRDLMTAAEKVVAQRSALEKQVQQLKAGATTGAAELTACEIDGVRLVHGIVPDADAEMLVAQAERAAKESDGIAVLGGASDGKVIFVARVMPAAIARGLHAGNVVREVAKAAGGGGGGRPDFAQAGGRDPGRLGEAMAKVEEIVRAQVR